MTEAEKKAKKKYRAKGKRLTVDFYPSEADLIAHLEKQEKKQTYIKDLIRADIPQKPAEKFPFDVCPRCGRVVNKSQKYCPECGLALDWSDSYVKIPQNFDGDLKQEVDKQLNRRKSNQKTSEI